MRSEVSVSEKFPGRAELRVHVGREDGKAVRRYGGTAVRRSGGRNGGTGGRDSKPVLCIQISALLPYRRTAVPPYPLTTCRPAQTARDIRPGRDAPPW